jgi:hypothetical protein
MVVDITFRSQSENGRSREEAMGRFHRQAGLAIVGRAAAWPDLPGVCFQKD